MAISLLPSALREEKKAKVTRLISRGLLLTLLFYIIAAVAFGSFFAFALIKKRQVVSRHSSLTGEVRAMLDREAQVLVLKDKVSTLSTIFSERFTFKRALEVATNLVGQTGGGFGVEIVDISNDKKNVKLTVSGTDTFALERFFSNLVTSPELSEAVLENITRFKDSNYIASITIQL